MAFLRVEQKKSGTYLRIVQSFKDQGVTRHKTLHSLGKVEDYPTDQLRRMATKLLELSGARLEDLVKEDLHEVRRVNYGYALVLKALWKKFGLDTWMSTIAGSRRIRFDWLSSLELMLAQRLSDPGSKHACYHHQNDYIGIGEKESDLQHLYRTLDLLSEEQESLKQHVFTRQQSLFSGQLDVVFYDVTTLYFDSQKEDQDSLRQKGYSKDGKAHKTQLVLGLLVDKLRNPITYHVYKGNTYEGSTLIDALTKLREQYQIDQVVAVADSAMIDADNRTFMEGCEGLDYILGDRIKNLPKAVSEYLLDPKNHHSLSYKDHGRFTYSTRRHKNRTIIGTYSEKRARKDRHEREKLLAKAEQLLAHPAKLNQSKKRGAGRFIKSLSGQTYALDTEKIAADQRWDGYKAISTTTSLSITEVLDKYGDLFEVEHAFRSLKSELQVRPIFHWTNKRIEGHIALCFLAYTMLNYLRLTTGLQQRELVRALDQMQLSEIKEGQQKETFFLRSKISTHQQTLIDSLNLVVPKDMTPQSIVHQYFS
jgi:transposase